MHFDEIWAGPLLLLPMAANRDEWPPMVRMALMRFCRRGLAIGFVWLTISLTFFAIAFGIRNADWRAFVLSGVMSIVTLWYGLSIRWVDRNSHWG